MPRPPDTNWKEPSPRSPAPQIDPVFLWPTPDKRDFLFYVEKNGDLPVNQKWTYGDPYIDRLKYPNHELVYVAPQDANKWSKWYYACKRADQDKYNWTLAPTQELTRGYFIKRAEYLGRLEADVVAGTEVNNEFFRPLVGTADTLFTNLIFADDTVIDAPDELKSLFVIINRRFMEDIAQVKRKGVESLVPSKFRRFITQIITTTQKALGLANADDLPDPASPTGNQTLIEHKKATDFRYEETVVTQVIDAEVSPLVGQIAYIEKEVANTSESLVADGTAATSGLLVSSSRVEPNGDGTSTKSDVTVPSWTTHFGQDYDPIHETPLPYSEVFATSGTGLGNDNTIVTPVNKDRVLVVVQNIPVYLDDYMSVSPTKIHVDLPRVLESATVAWNVSTDIGTQDYTFNETVYGDSYSLGDKYSDTAKSSAHVSADVQLVWKDYGNGTVMGEEYSFYVKNPVTVAAIMAKCGAAAYWPVFKTKSPSVTIMSQSISVQCTASCGLNAVRNDGSIVREGYEIGTSDDFGVTISQNTIQIPPCLMGDLSFTDQEQEVSAVANVSMTHSDIGTITSVITKSGTAYGKVMPLNITGTTETDIPNTGKFITDASVRPYKWGYSYVTAQVIDATIFT